MTGGDVADPKLNHLVRKYLSSVHDEKNGENANKVVDWLRKKYREYQRKDIGKLRCQVQTILTGIKENLKESAYDRDARAHDEQRSKMGKNMNTLNASLTNQYRKLQQERDAEERANIALQESEASDLHENNETDITEMNGEKGSSKKRLREDSNSTVGASNSSSEKRTSKIINNGKSSKRKKSSGARRNASKSSYTETGAPGKDESTSISEPIPRPNERYTDLGGMQDVLIQIRQLVEYPLVRPELYRHLGVDPPRGVLLRGPPG